MCGDERYWAKLPIRSLLLILLACSGAHAQQITSLQASTYSGNPGSPGNPANVTGITSGTPQNNGGFVLWINGVFAAGANFTVNWLNPQVSPNPFQLTILSPPSNIQIVALVPNTFFQAAVASQQQVQVTVIQNGNPSQPAFF